VLRVVWESGDEAGRVLRVVWESGVMRLGECSESGARLGECSESGVRLGECPHTHSTNSVASCVAGMK